MAEIVMGLVIAALLVVLISIFHRQTKTEEEFQEELRGYVVDYLKHNPGPPRRDSKGRFTSSEPENGV